MTGQQDAYETALEWLAGELARLAAGWEAEAGQFRAAAAQMRAANIDAAGHVFGRAGDFDRHASDIRDLAARAMGGQYPPAGGTP